MRQTELTIKNTEITKDSLRNNLTMCPNARIGFRIAILQEVINKEEIKTISDRHNFSRSQIYKLVERVNKYGLEGLLDDPHTGRKQRITIDQKEELLLALSQKPIKKGYAQAEWDGPLLVKYMNDVFNLEYSVRQAQRLMKSLGYNVR